MIHSKDQILAYTAYYYLGITVREWTAHFACDARRGSSTELRRAARTAYQRIVNSLGAA